MNVNYESNQQSNIVEQEMSRRREVLDEIASYDAEQVLDWLLHQRDCVSVILEGYNHADALTEASSIAMCGLLRLVQAVDAAMGWIEENNLTVEGVLPEHNTLIEPDDEL